MEHSKILVPKNYYIFQPKDSPERPLMVPLEELEPCQDYHTYHLEGSVTNRAFSNRIHYNNERKAELRNPVKTSITEINVNDITYLLEYFLSHYDHFVKELKHYRNRTNHSQKTEKL